MKGVIRVIESTSEWAGKIGGWFCIPLILVLVYEVVARYVFDAPTIWAHESARMLGATVVALGWAYVHRYREHVTIDVVYTRLSPRGQALIDVLCTLVFFFPLLVVVTWSSFDFTRVAWAGHEVLIESYWYPPSGPIRMVVTLGLCLFMLQGIANFVRDLHLLIRNKPYD